MNSKFEISDKIHKICKRYAITNYTINDDESIDVDGDVCLNYNFITELPLKFNYVKGNFNCKGNLLTTLKGSPMSVDGNFDCSENFLITLNYSPKWIGGDFDCSENFLTTLEGAPELVNTFLCSDNEELKSLNYLSKCINTEEVYFKNTLVSEVFKLLDNFSLHAIRSVNDYKIIVDDKIDIEMLNAFLYDLNKSLVENVDGYSLV